MEVAEVKLLGLNEITEAPYPFLKTLISFHFLTFCLPWISSKNDGCRVIKQVIVSKLQVSVLSVGAQLPCRGQGAEIPLPWHDHMERYGQNSLRDTSQL